MLFRSVDILELSEQKDLLKFHYHTLRLYSAICALGNNRVAHALCSRVDESQLLLAIENKYMPGNTYRRGQAKVVTCVLKGYGWNYSHFLTVNKFRDPTPAMTDSEFLFLKFFISHTF